MKKKTPGKKLSLNKKVITSMDTKSQAALKGGKTTTAHGPTEERICYSGTGYCVETENCA